MYVSLLLQFVVGISVNTIDYNDLSPFPRQAMAWINIDQVLWHHIWSLCLSDIINSWERHQFRQITAKWLTSSKLWTVETITMTVGLYRIFWDTVTGKVYLVKTTPAKYRSCLRGLITVGREQQQHPSDLWAQGRPERITQGTSLGTFPRGNKSRG